MDNISITKQYNELDEYSQIKDYINKVLDNFNDLDKLDSNDIYEITYAKRICESKLAQGIENDGTREAFEDTLARISLITDLLSDNIIKKAMSNTLNKDKLTKVNSSRHAKSNKMPDLPDKSNPKFANPIHEYTKRIASKLVMQAILFICMLNANDVSRIVMDAMSKVFNGTEQVTSNPTDAFIQVTGMINTVMHLLIILMFFVLCISMILDIMYITFPWFRCMVDDRKSNEIDNNSGFVSEYAIDAVKSADTVVGYHKFSNNDINKKNIYDVVNDSVKHHMIANVEVGTFLSGGIDSTIVTALAANINPKIKSFSIGFDVEGYNELTIAKKTAEYLGIENISVNVSEQDYIKALPSVAYYMDNPLADPSCVGIYLLSKEARKHVKVVLSGEGSDELFGGYNIYKEYYSLKPFSYLPEVIKCEVNKIAKSLPDIKGKNYLLRGTTKLKDRYIGNAKIFSNEEVKNIMYNYDKNNTYSNILSNLYEECDKNNYDNVTTMQYIDMNTWLEGDILLKADKMSMAHSLELRVPFLDKEVLKCAEGLTLSQKISKNNTKVLLREAFKDIVPPYMKEKKKLGFPTPIRVWLKSDLGRYVREIINNAEVDKLINKKYIINLLDEHIRGKKDNSRKIWTVFMFCLWYQIYIEGKSVSELEAYNDSNKNHSKCKLA